MAFNVLAQTVAFVIYCAAALHFIIILIVDKYKFYPEFCVNSPPVFYNAFVLFNNILNTSRFFTTNTVDFQRQDML